MGADLIGLLPGVPEHLPGTPVNTLEEARALSLPLVLGFFDGYLALKASEGKENPVSVDFSGGKQGYRLAADRVRHERLIKALGGMPTEPLSVIDGTGGLGRDALVMAQAGFHVDVIERSPIIHALLADGVRRLEGEDRALAARLTLHCADSAEWIQRSNKAHFAVYLDPMFPQRQKSAAIKKDLLWLQQLEKAPEENEAHELLNAARDHAAKRVVVKRPVRAVALDEQKPSYSLEGKAVRFDVYIKS
ncbi:MAG: class I SAM-dependent methyltransferase [Alcanivoracaceae bacterium]|nr:class I SAM-dependent methyltransferase [Alcanivoracaceae bacterium]